MQFTVLRQTLRAALENIKATVKPVTGDNYSTFVKVEIKPKEQEMSLVGYNLETGAISVLNVEAVEYAEFLVSIEDFAAIVSKLDGETLECSAENDVLTIKCGRSRTKIPTQNADNYPSIPDVTATSKLTMSAVTLSDMIRQTVFAVSVLDNKPILMGELFEIKDNNFNLVAVDGYRLAVRTEAVSTSDTYNFVVKGDTLRSVMKLAKSGDITLIPSKKHIVFDFGRTKIFTRLLEGDFHNYKASLPKGSATTVEIATKPLIECLERFCLLINSKSKAPVRCNFNSGKLEMSLKTIRGEMSDSVDIDFAGTPVEIGFNVQFMLDIIKAAESDRVKFSLNGPVAPMTVTPLDGNAYTYLVLPVRLKNN